MEILNNAKSWVFVSLQMNISVLKWTFKLKVKKGLNIININAK